MASTRGGESGYQEWRLELNACTSLPDGDKLAVAASYTGEEGEKDSPRDAIYVRAVNAAEVTPKSFQQQQWIAAADAAQSDGWRKSEEGREGGIERRCETWTFPFFIGSA